MKRILSFLIILSAYGLLFSQDTVSANATPDSVQRNDSTIIPDSLSAKSYASLHITSVPDSTDIFLDSLLSATAPCRFDSLAPGSHVVIAKKKGYFGKKLTIDLIADSALHIQVSLVKPSGIVLFSNPPGAKVYLDNKEAGTTPWENTRLKPGAHAVKLEKDGYILYEKSVELPEGITDSLTIQFQANPAAPAPKKAVSLEKVIPLAAAAVIVVFALVILGIELSPSGK